MSTKIPKIFQKSATKKGQKEEYQRSRYGGRRQEINANRDKLINFKSKYPVKSG